MRSTIMRFSARSLGFFPSTSASSLSRRGSGSLRIVPFMGLVVILSPLFLRKKLHRAAYELKTGKTDKGGKGNGLGAVKIQKP